MCITAQEVIETFTAYSLCQGLPSLSILKSIEGAITALNIQFNSTLFLLLHNKTYSCLSKIVPLVKNDFKKYTKITVIS